MIRRDDEKVDWLKCIGNTEGTGRKCGTSASLRKRYLKCYNGKDQVIVIDRFLFRQPI